MQKLEELEHTLASLAGFRFYSRCVFDKVGGEIYSWRLEVRMTPFVFTSDVDRSSHASSLLIIYNGLNPECQVDDRVEVRLIDFAQTITPLSSFYDESQHR